VKRLQNLASIFTRPKPQVGMTPADVVHRENKWRLLRYRPREGGPAYGTPVLLVPSLINRHYVMDLLPGKSMAEDLVRAGHDVYCIDWGTPGDEDRYLTFDDVADRYLGRALRKVARTSPSGKAHVLGYCLGGTLATIHAAVHPEHVASLLLLAAPVRFGDEGLLAAWTKSPSFRVGDVVEGFGNVPWQLMQSAFHLLRPTLGLAKTVGMIDRAANDEFLDGFLALETWGNDNVSFPGACFERYIEELYRGDALMRGEFTLSGARVDLRRIACPTMCVVFEHDNIVPWESAAVLAEVIASTDKEVLKLPGGHVGAVVSRAAQKKLWPKMSAFWAARDGAANGAVTGASPGPDAPVSKTTAKIRPAAKKARPGRRTAKVATR
jgi:polyhydroxyalkanoate synthase subunit PhaC